MSDNPQDNADEAQPSGGAFGVFSVDDSKIGVIRQPENAHLDQNDQEEKPSE